MGVLSAVRLGVTVVKGAAGPSQPSVTVRVGKQSTFGTLKRFYDNSFLGPMPYARQTLIPCSS